MTCTMKVPAILCLALALQLEAKAQNLIPNSSFEEYNYECWMAFDGTLNVWGWAQPDCAEMGGYFNTCFTPGSTNNLVPGNFAGYTAPSEGDAYISVLTYNELASNGMPEQYLTVALWESLEAGEIYCIQMKMSLCDSSSYRTRDFHCFLSLDTPSVCGSNGEDLAINSLVTLNTDLVDTAGWTLVEASFVANGGESVLTFGDFNRDANIDTTFIADQATPQYAGYYIDEVYLGACDIGEAERNEPSAAPSIYPNPARTDIRVDLGTWSEHATIEVHDIRGKLLLAESVTGPIHFLNVVSLPDGIYFLHLKQPNKLLVSPFVVQR